MNSGAIAHRSNPAAGFVELIGSSPHLDIMFFDVPFCESVVYNEIDGERSTW